MKLRDAGLWLILSLGLAGCGQVSTSSVKESRQIFPQSAACVYSPQIAGLPSLFDGDRDNAMIVLPDLEIVLKFQRMPASALHFRLSNGYAYLGEAQRFPLARKVSVKIMGVPEFVLKLPETSNQQTYSMNLPPNFSLEEIRFSLLESHLPESDGAGREAASIGELGIFVSSSDEISNAEFPKGNFLVPEKPASRTRAVDLEPYTDDRSEGVQIPLSKLKAMKPITLIQRDPEGFFQLFQTTGLTFSTVTHLKKVLANRNNLATSNVCLPENVAKKLAEESAVIDFSEIVDCQPWESPSVVENRLKAAMVGLTEGERSETLSSRVLSDANGRVQYAISRSFRRNVYFPWELEACTMIDKIFVFDTLGRLSEMLQLEETQSQYQKQSPTHEEGERLVLTKFFRNEGHLDSTQHLEAYYHDYHEGGYHILERKFWTEE